MIVTPLEAILDRLIFARDHAGEQSTRFAPPATETDCDHPVRCHFFISLLNFDVLPQIVRGDVRRVDGARVIGRYA